MTKVIAIDGPAGSGKSTVARKLAKKLGFIHLNSGVLYRALAKRAIESKVSFDDESELANLASALKFDFSLTTENQTKTFVNKAPVFADELSSPEISQVASRIAKLAAVRDVFLKVQRSLAKEANLVVEGRDAGTVVFPNAFKKFYLDAKLEVRARRRFDELRASGSQLSLTEIESQMAKRDEQDSTREIAPSVCAEDAIVIDTSFSGIDEIVEQLFLLTTEKQK